MSCQVQYSGTQPTMSEEELWDSVCGKEESPIVTINGINGYCLGYWHNNPVTNCKNFVCKSCDKQYESKYISFPMIHVDLCSKECYTCYQSQLPEKIWGTICMNNETMVIPFTNKAKPFTLLTNQEIDDLSTFEKQKYYEAEEQYSSLYPLKVIIHHETQENNQYIQSVEDEYNNSSSNDDDDY